jgi:dual specificity tyrosine-phosphorylation-regulated kinase 1
MEDGAAAAAAAAGGGGGSEPLPGANTNPHGVRASLDSPMRKLTTGLLATYKAINVRYYEKKKARAAAGGKHESGTSDYVLVVGQVLGGRYKVLESIGKGSFGQVVAAEDTREGPHQGRRVAVKIIKAREAFRKQAKMEIKLLEMLNQKDPEDQWCIGAWGGAPGQAAASGPLRAARARVAPPQL